MDMRNKRYNTLDLLRFFAAMSVTFYHLVFGMFPEYDILLDFFKYGMWGVIVFFVISGFVIINSTVGKMPLEFVQRRILRLYPAYWISLAYVFISLSILERQIDFPMFLANITMLQEFIGIDHMNGVYWTLSFELLFYFYILVFIMVLKIPIDIFVIGWVVILAAAKAIDATIVVKLLLGNYAVFFLLGMALYLTITKRKFLTYFALFVTLWLALDGAFILIEDYSAYLKREFSFSGVSLYLFIIIALALLFRRLNSNIALYMGKISYPLYLVHSPCIWIASEYYSGSTSLFIAICLIFCVSALVLLIEEAVRKKLRI
ncbi:acyltransferase family protein [Lentibacter algarum]|uniref:acyltransferase family protein n=1 Tax=Lentibacter algarum TaxID=576131 RepID=UPI0024911E83|nr:acyltransferase [Lentibacter algarum]